MTLAMPYDEGWTVTIDGEETELIAHSSHWMMFAVPKGDHEIEMHYAPLGLKEGKFASAATLLMVLLALLLTKMRAARFAAEEAAEGVVAETAQAQTPSAKTATTEAAGENPPQEAQ